MLETPKSRLYEFERTMILGVRAIKKPHSGKALLATLAGMLTAIQSESVLAKTPALAEIHSDLTIQLNQISTALSQGANEKAQSLYATLIENIPSLHAMIASIADEQLRGGSPTDDPALVDAVSRALALLS